MSVGNITLAEISKLANTSTATVSRVLSGSDYPVSQELRKKIEAIARETNYVPNSMGKALKSGRSQDIGVIVPNFTNPFYAQLISGIQSECRERGYNPIFCSSDNSIDYENQSINLLLQKCVEGLIVSSLSSDYKFLKRSLNSNINIVLFDQEIDGLDCDYVTFKFVESGYMATRFLIEQGHRDIAFLSAPLNQRKSRASLYRGYLNALDEFKIELPPDRLIISQNTNDHKDIHEAENGRLLARSFLSLETRPTAAFIYNDVTAFGVISELQANGVRVPDDISVVGFDDIPMAEYFNPPLTTINQPAFTTGLTAAQILLDKIQNKSLTSSKITFHPTLVERSSVKKLK